MRTIGEIRTLRARIEEAVQEQAKLGIPYDEPTLMAIEAGLALLLKQICSDYGEELTPSALDSLPDENVISNRASSMLARLEFYLGMLAPPIAVSEALV